MRSRLVTIATLGALAAGGGIAYFTRSAPVLSAIRNQAQWDDATTKVDTVCLAYLPDGGARARVLAGALLVDGGPGPYNPQLFELSGAARTTALSALDTGRTAWINAQP